MRVKDCIKKTICSMAVMVAGVIFAAAGARAAGSVAINEVNFPDANFRAYVSSAFDIDKNGVLTDEEISKATTINVRDRGIFDITGIAVFTELRSLNCSNNSIRSISLASNSAITYLNVSGNQLTSLSVAKNVLLRTLICGGNNIASLDLKSNGDISYVDVSGNDLSVIDVSKCAGLSTLNISDNQLVSVDLRSNTELATLTADTNQLTSLDVSANTRLVSINVSGNGLASLDVSAAKTLKTLDCSDNKILSLKLTDSIESLACSNNELTRLDVGELLKLRTLDVSDNGLYSLDVASNKELVSINASDNNLGMLDVTGNTLLNEETIVLKGNKREVYMAPNGELLTSEAGIDVDKITSINTAGVVSGQALTAGVTEAALIVSDVKAVPGTASFTYDIGNGHKADFVVIPVNKKKLVPAAKTISLYMSEGNAAFPLYVTPIGGAADVRWSSSDNRVASVDQQGILTVSATGSAKVTASADGYESALFTINVYKQPNNISVSDIGIQYYTGKEVKPEPVVKDGDVVLVKDTDYTLAYENNVSAGRAIITINGKDKYSFKLSRRFSICYNIATLTATAIPDQLFTGSAVTPDVVIMNGAYRLEKGKDYTLTYMNNTAIGTGIVTITGTAKYAGVKVQSFNILVPQVTNLVKKGNVKTSITLTWDKIDGVTGYRVYRYNPATKKYAFLKQVAGSTNNTYTDKSLTAGTQYRYRVRAYVKVNNVNSYGKYSAKYKTYTKFKKAALKTKAGKKKATLSWKKITGVTGYRVYMKNRKGKYAKIKELKGAGKIKYTKTGLKRGKTYYFRVRAFKTVNGSNIYGAYSTIKTVIAK